MTLSCPAAMLGLPLAEQLGDGDHQPLQVAAPLDADVGAGDARRVARQRLVARLVLAGLLGLLVERLGRSRSPCRRSSSRPRRSPGRPRSRSASARRSAFASMSLAALYSALAYFDASTVSAVRSDELGGGDLLLARELQRQALCSACGLLLFGRHLLRQPLLVGLRGLARLDVLLEQRQLLVLVRQLLWRGRRTLPRPWPAARTASGSSPSAAPAPAARAPS